MVLDHVPLPVTVEMGTAVGDQGERTPSNSFTGSESASQPEYDVKFNKGLRDPWYIKLFDRTVVVLAQTAQILYLTWRWYHFVTTKSTLPFSLPFIISETLIVFGGSFITYFMVWNQVRRPKLRLHDLKIERRELPTVDVMIPCYNEPVEVRTTRRQNYPRHPCMTCMVQADSTV
jgi:hypothetical protein